MKKSSQKYLLLKFLPVMGVIFLLVPLLVGVWLPDVLFADRPTLASKTLANGYGFHVIQYWNHVDFYSTELHVTAPDGRNLVHTLDGDDIKSWRLPLVIEEQHRTATVTLRGGRVRVVDW